MELDSREKIELSPSGMIRLTPTVSLLPRAACGLLGFAADPVPRVSRLRKRRGKCVSDWRRWWPETGSVCRVANGISKLHILKGAERAKRARMPKRSCKSLANKLSGPPAEPTGPSRSSQIAGCYRSHSFHCYGPPSEKRSSHPLRRYAALDCLQNRYSQIESPEASSGNS